MSKKREFPSDWSNMPDDEVLENIAYLLANYKRYKVKTDYCLETIGSVVIRTDIDKSKPGWLMGFHINNKRIDWDTELGKMVNCLWQEVDYYKRPVNKKLNKFWQDYSETIGWGLVGLALSSSLIFAHVYENKKQEQFKQEIIKEALEQFRQEQQQDTILYQPKRQK